MASLGAAVQCATTFKARKTRSLPNKKPSLANRGDYRRTKLILYLQGGSHWARGLLLSQRKYPTGVGRSWGGQTPKTNKQKGQAIRNVFKC